MSSEYEDDDYEDDEYEDDFDDDDEENDQQKWQSIVPVNHSNSFDLKGASHSVLLASKSTFPKSNKKESECHSAWYGVDAADSSLHPNADSVGSSNASDPPMPPNNNFQAPAAPTIITSTTGQFRSNNQIESPSTAWSPDRIPMTVESARGSAALLPYHTQQIRRGHWRLGKKIGAGTFGVVHQGLNDDNGMAVAVKVMKRMGRDDAAVKELENEITLMQKLDHPNIVRYLGCQVDPECCYIFCEWVPCGSLADMIKNYGPLGEPILKRYLLQILAGLSYLHERLIVHRDLKGGNVLVNEFGEAKLADFGCSKTMSAEGTLGEVAHGSIKGTPYFMAPEVIKNERAGRPSDVWSLGGVIYQMITGDPPWKALNFKTPVVLFYHVVNANEPPPLAGVSKELEALVGRCFARDPSARPSAVELMQDSFFADPSPTHTVPTTGQNRIHTTSSPMSETLQEIAEIFTPVVDSNRSPPPCEISSPEPSSPATHSSRDVVAPPSRPVEQEPLKGMKNNESNRRRRKVDRKWGVNGYQKPTTAPDKKTLAETGDLRPISAPVAQQPEVMVAPGRKSSLSKFKQRFQDPARISLHDLKISQNDRAAADER